MTYDLGVAFMFHW